MVATLAEAVHHAHAHGVLHRDLKPGNVLLEKPYSGAEPRSADEADFIPQITDFGLAKILESENRDTRSGVLLGTPLYMAPEQAEGRSKDVGPGTDIYALGVILYELITGRPPIRGTSDADTLRRVVSEEPASPGRLRSHVPRDLATICMKCLEKDPPKRYASALALSEDLRRFLAYEPIRARPASFWDRAKKWTRRRPAVVALIAACLLAVIGLFLGGWYLGVLTQAHNAEMEGAVALQNMLSDEAEAQKLRAGQAEQFARGRLYVSRIRAAKLARDNGHFEQFREYLADQRFWQPEDPRSFEWYYLWRMVPRTFASLFGHNCDYLTSVAFSPNGRTLASGGRDRMIKLWDVASGKERASIECVGDVQTVAFSPSGNLLASWDHQTVRLWDPNTCRELQRIPSSIPCLAFSPNGNCLALADADKDTILLWDLSQRKEIRRLKGPGRKVDCLDFGSDNSTLVAGYYDSSITLWNANTGQACRSWTAQAGGPAGIALSRNGRLLATWSNWYFDVKIWDMATAQLLQTLTGHTSSIDAAAFSPDSSILATGSRDSSVTLWDARSGQRLWHYQWRRPVNSVAFSPTGNLLAMAGQDSGVELLDLSTECRPLYGHEAQAWSLTFSPDGQTMASAGDDHLLRIWDLGTGREKAVLGGHESLVWAVAFSPDGRILASASHDHTVKLWDAVTLKERLALRGHTDQVRCVAIAPDSGMVASAGRDKEIKLWDAVSGRLQRSWRGHERKVRAVAFAPDGRTLASASEDGTVKLWQVATGSLQVVINDTDEIWCMSFSPDGRTLAAGNKAGIVTLLDVSNTKHRLLLQGHTASIKSLAFTPDGRTIATGSDDRNIKLWHVLTGQELLTLNGHKDLVNSVAFSPNGRTLGSAGQDGRVNLWRAAEDAELAPK
jgi:WD40 repeat protein